MSIEGEEVILDFNHVVSDKDMVENLAEMIVAEEREAIAAWALEGLRRLIDQKGYTLPECHHARVAQMRRIVAVHPAGTRLDAREHVQVHAGDRAAAIDWSSCEGAHTAIVQVLILKPIANPATATTSPMSTPWS